MISPSDKSPLPIVSGIEDKEWEHSNLTESYIAEVVKDSLPKPLAPSVPVDVTPYALPGLLEVIQFYHPADENPSNLEDSIAYWSR
jgi:hypothetical protein